MTSAVRGRGKPNRGTLAAREQSRGRRRAFGGSHTRSQAETQSATNPLKEPALHHRSRGEGHRNLPLEQQVQVCNSGPPTGTDGHARGGGSDLRVRAGILTRFTPQAYSARCTGPSQLNVGEQFMNNRHRIRLRCARRAYVWRIPLRRGRRPLTQTRGWKR